MKLLTPKEVVDRKQAEVVKDISRTESVKKALDTVTGQLNESEARFAMALSNQRVRWSREEQEATNRIKELNEEIKTLEDKLKTSIVPIEEREKKSYALFIEAEKVLADAHSKLHESEQIKESNSVNEDLLMDKLDSFHEKQQDLDLRESKLIVREKAVEEERAVIRNLSKELSIKLTNLK